MISLWTKMLLCENQLFVLTEAHAVAFRECETGLTYRFVTSKFSTIQITYGISQDAQISASKC